MMLRGIPASEGIAIASVFRYRSKTSIEIPQECRASDRELERLNHALEKFKISMDNLIKVIDESERDLIQAYILMSEALVNEARELIANNNVCGELAIKQVLEKYLALMDQTSELFALRKSDLIDIAFTIIEHMRREHVLDDIAEAKDKIVVAEELTPTTFFRIQRMGIRGIVTVKGGITSHVAILARTYGIPYVIVPSLEISNINDGALAIVDGFDGVVFVEPSNTLLEEYRRKASVVNEIWDLMKRYMLDKARTVDGHYVEVLCNVGNVEEARVASSQGCEGVGLFRVEYLYMTMQPPTEDTLMNTFIKVANFFEGKPVVIRAPDLGADKPPPFISIREDNPLLGVRGIRFLLEYRSEILKPFLRGFLRAFTQYRNLKLMIPMVIKPSEVYEFIEVMDVVAKELGISNIEDLELGIMIETPAAAILIDKFAKIPHLKFVSFGTNDLTQYVLAVDRTNPKLMNIYNELEPSVLRIIAKSVEDSLGYGLKVEICGELASKPIAIPLLLAFGFRSLSINPRYTGLIKYIISNMDLSVLKDLKKEILNADNVTEVENLIVKALQARKIDLRPILLFSRSSLPLTT